MDVSLRGVAAIVTLTAALSPTLARAVGPGPDETADAQYYDVELRRGWFGESGGGTFTFFGDPERPDDLESGEFESTLTTLVDDEDAEDDDTEAPATMSAAGAWWALRFGDIGLWLAVGTNDADEGLLAYGIAYESSLYARAFVRGGESFDSGRYRLTGDVTDAPPEVEVPDVEDPVAEEPAEDDESGDTDQGEEPADEGGEEGSAEGSEEGEEGDVLE